MKQFRNNLSKWWHRASGASRRPASRHSLTRLTLEHLEDRRVMSVYYGGGALLQNVQVENIYYGSAWLNNPTLYQSAVQLNGVMNDITQSSYMDMLGEYYVGRGQFQDGQINPNDPYRGNIVDDSEIQGMLDWNISQGYFQPPSPNQLYVVYTAPYVDVTLGGGDSQHNFLGYHNTFWDPNLGSIYYAVIAHPVGNADIPGLNYFQQQTKVTSHELTEAVTDPNTQSGWRDYYYTGEEIGDLCNNPPLGMYHGYVVQSEWSNYWQGCALPNDATWFYPNSPSPGDHGGPGSLRVIDTPASRDTTGFARLSDLAGLGVDLVQPLASRVVPTTGDPTATTARVDDFFAGLAHRDSDSTQLAIHRRSDTEDLTSFHDLGTSLKLHQDEAPPSLDASFSMADDLMIEPA